MLSGPDTLRLHSTRNNALINPPSARSGGEAPARISADLSHQSIGGFPAREEEAVADRVQRRTNPREAFGSRLEQRIHAVVLRQPVLGGERKATLAHLIVVVEIGTATTIPALGDVIRKHSAKPQRVIPQVRAHQKAPSRVTMVNVSQQGCHRVVQLIVRPTDAVRVVTQCEVHENRGDVIGNAAIMLVNLLQRVTDDDVGEQGQRCVCCLTTLDQGVAQSRIVQNGIDSVTTQRFLGRRVFGF